MKKLLALMLALLLALSLVACGGEDTPDATQNPSGGTETAAPSDDSGAGEVELVPMTFGHITINVPSVFSDVKEQEGGYVSTGPNASSIIVTPVGVPALQPSEWDETVVAESLEMLYGATYSDLQLAGFEGDINMNGNTAVYYAFFGTNSSGIERLIQVVILYNADLTGEYTIAFVHDANDEFFTAELANEIVNSITLDPEAQNLAPEN